MKIGKNIFCKGFFEYLVSFIKYYNKPEITKNNRWYTVKKVKNLEKFK